MSKIPLVDIDKRNALLAKLAAMGMKLNSEGIFEFDEGDEFPRYVSLEDFFEGTVDTDTDFAVNIPDHPGNGAMYELLKSFRNREDVLDVVVGVLDAEGFQGHASPYWWIYSDHVVVISSIPEEDIVDHHESEVLHTVYSTSTSAKIRTWFTNLLSKTQNPYKDEHPSYTSEIIKTWFGKFYPDDVSKLPASEINTRYGIPQPPPGYSAYYLWWD